MRAAIGLIAKVWRNPFFVFENPCSVFHKG